MTICSAEDTAKLFLLIIGRHSLAVLESAIMKIREGRVFAAQESMAWAISLVNMSCCDLADVIISMSFLMSVQVAPVG